MAEIICSHCLLPVKLPPTLELCEVPSPAVRILRAASLLGISRRTVYDYIKRGWLKTTRIGTSQCVLKSSILRLRIDSDYKGARISEYGR